MSEKDVLQLKKSLDKELAKIKALLGQDPEDSKKSLAQIQEELRKGLNEKNWVKSVRIFMLTDRLKDSIDSFEEAIEKSKKMIFLNSLSMITESLYEVNPKIRLIIPSKKNRVSLNESRN